MYINSLKPYKAPSDVYYYYLYFEIERMNSKWKEPALEPRLSGFTTASYWLLGKRQTEIDSPNHVVLIQDKENNRADSKVLSNCSKEKQANGLSRLELPCTHSLACAVVTAHGRMKSSFFSGQSKWLETTWMFFQRGLINK